MAIHSSNCAVIVPNLFRVTRRLEDQGSVHLFKMFYFQWTLYLKKTHSQLGFGILEILSKKLFKELPKKKKKK